MATTHARLPDPLHERAQEVQDEHDLATIGEALRYMVRTGGYDV